VKGLRIARTSEAIASPLVLATGICVCVDTPDKTALHELHTRATSRFSVPHFGQYILRSPFDLIFGHFKSPQTIFSQL
jgi:hypothetical protein